MGSWDRWFKVDSAVRGSGEVDGAERGVGGAWLIISDHIGRFMTRDSEKSRKVTDPKRRL
jgi:hypothetical protein